MSKEGNVLSREMFDARKPPKNNQFDGRDAEDLCVTIDALATALNAHPENPTELKAHEDLVDMLREKGWLG